MENSFEGTQCVSSTNYNVIAPADLPHVPLPSPLVGGHSSPSEVMTFDSIFQNIMDQKAMQVCPTMNLMLFEGAACSETQSLLVRLIELHLQAQQQPDLNDQRISTTPSDLSTKFHLGHPGSALSHQASLEQFQQSQLGRSLSNQASLGQLLQMVSMDR